MECKKTIILLALILLVGCEANLECDAGRANTRKIGGDWISQQEYICDGDKWITIEQFEELKKAYSLGYNSSFLQVTDTIGRTVAPPYEVPAGIITGFTGGLFFLIFIIRSRKY